MRDRRVGQHALDVGLCDGGEVTNGHRQHGKDQQHVLPVLRGNQQPADQHTYDDGESSQFRRAGDDQRHRRRGAVINVGNPHVEGHDTEFESETGDQEDHTKNQHGHVSLTGEQALGNARNEQGAGRAIDHRHAIEQHARGQGTEYEIFHSRLGRPH